LLDLPDQLAAICNIDPGVAQPQVQASHGLILGAPRAAGIIACLLPRVLDF
jgi:hypothetical protein